MTCLTLKSQQERFVKVESLIKDLDTAVWMQLQDHSPRENAGKDVVKDQEFNGYVRNTILSALTDGLGTNVLVNKMVEFYQSDTKARIKTYNAFMESNFQDESSALIRDTVNFGDLTLDQKIGLGLYMTSIGELKFN